MIIVKNGEAKLAGTPKDLVADIATAMLAFRHGMARHLGQEGADYLF